jgi:hypothetical protein
MPFLQIGHRLATDTMPGIIAALGRVKEPGEWLPILNGMHVARKLVSSKPACQPAKGNGLL